MYGSDPVRPEENYYELFRKIQIIFFISDIIVANKYRGVKNMNNKRIVYGLIIGIVMSILWSIVFVNVLFELV